MNELEKSIAIYERALHSIIELAEINKRFDHVWAIAYGALADASNEGYVYTGTGGWGAGQLHTQDGAKD